MANNLTSSKTVVREAKTLFIVDQSVDSALYTAVTGGTVTLPPNSFVQVITSGDVVTTRLTGATEAVWASASPVGASGASQAAVAAITSIATADATDLATSLVLLNICKAKINSLISALKA